MVLLEGLNATQHFLLELVTNSSRGKKKKKKTFTRSFEYIHCMFTSR
jgi:hypothetical protein